MSLLQKTYVDYRNLGDKGQNNTSSIQPVIDGEPGSMQVFARPSENLRSRTEIVRSVFDDLLYYRDRTSRYLIESAGGSALTWEVGGVGRVNNLGALTIRPFVTPRTNLKGILDTGVALTNQMYYQVNGGAYATDGMNAITMEHRNVPGTVTPVVSITAGPIYRILVVFDSSNGGHVASVIAGLINAAIAGVAALSGRLTVVANGDVTPIAVIPETPIDIRSHTGGTDGQATADVEAHTIPLGFLGTFTTTNPLAEGDLLAIRYDYIIEPGTDPNDPKGGVPGGRAESNQSRGNSDVSNNLFIAQSNPEWLPGCIPLCKVVNGNLHWVDGTVLASGASGAPGSGLGTFVNSSVFSGLPTVVVNGGIDNAGSIDTLQEALVSVDQRLSQHRFATYVVTDGTNSTGGAFNAATAFSSAIAALTPNGGTLIVRRGNYTTGFSAFTFAGSITIDGETSDRNTSFPASPILVTQTTAVTFATSVTIRNMAFTRTSTNRAVLSRDVTFERVTWASGTFTLGNSTGRFVNLRDCKMEATNIATDSPAGLILNGERVTATNCLFEGPDLAAVNTAIVFQGSNVLQAVYTNCSFINTTLNVAAFAFADTGNTYGTTFVDCYFRGIATGAFMIDLQTTYTGGDITFYNCRFDNTGGVPIIRTRHAGGRVRFVNCTFLCAGSPNGTGTQYQNMLAIAPAPATNALALATTTIENCSAFVNCTNFTGMTRTIVEFGSQNSAGALGNNTPVFGHVVVKGFTLSFSGATTVLPPTTCLLLTNRDGTVSAGQPQIGPHVFEDITILANQKSIPTTQSSVAGQPPHLLYASNNPIVGTLPTIRGVRICGIVAPQTDNINGGILYVAGYRVFDVRTQVDSSVATTNRHSGYQITIEAGEIANAELETVNWAGASALQLVASASYRAYLTNGMVLCPITGATTTGNVFRLAGGTLRGVRTRATPALNNALVSFIMLDSATYTAEVNDCDFDLSTCTVPFLNTNVVGGGFRARILGNKIITGQLAGGSVINLGTATPTGAVVSGNTIMTAGATAAGCVPSLAAAVDTLSLVTSNNTFSTSITTPS